ncbi:hypothetical protein SLS58_005772 [Diplodia intermedia]|uniref:Phenylacetaldoxime dehydratase n=1 Tax=Diplodia intermedia TaxID=856260 RepID=A0ABR3TPS5_9PEZI
MATICAQARDPSATLPAPAVLAPVLAFLERDADGDKTLRRPAAWDLVQFRDVAGMHNVGVVAYWDGGRKAWEAWARESGFEAWWGGLEPGATDVGWFREVLFPSIDRYETIFSNADVGDEGGARLREGLSGPVREHVYWGSMRDRMPAAQVDGLVGETETAGEEAGDGDGPTEGRRDWSDMVPRERKLYLETMHPVLVRGMDFLRDEGRAIGCHSCRFVDELDPADVGRETERTFGFAFFRDMEALEKWSKSHRTHLDIFGRFLQYVKELDGDISLRLFHEVLALTPEQQLLEYVGCHSRTGMLGV